jgi:hypothetical protein
MDAIDQALRELREVKPSPDFVPRLRAHVEASPRPVAWRFWIPASVVAMAATAALFIHTRPRLDAPVRSDRPLLTARATHTPVALAPRGLQRRVVLDSKPAARTPAAPASPHVLVPANQRDVMGRLLDSLAAGHDGSAAMVRSLGTHTAVAVAPIRIDPVVVQPLQVDAVTIGDFPDIK